MPCGSPVRRKRLMRWNEITGASSPSNSHDSTSISLPWLTSPDSRIAEDDLGDDLGNRGCPHRRAFRLGEELARVFGAFSPRLGFKALEAKMFDGDPRARDELRAALSAAPRSRSHSRDHGVSDPAAGVKDRPAAALTGSLTPCLPSVVVAVGKSRSSGRTSAALCS